MLGMRSSRAHKLVCSFPPALSDCTHVSYKFNQDLGTACLNSADSPSHSTFSDLTIRVLILQHTIFAS